MSGFQESFTRDNTAENLQFDETAFYFFFSGILITLLFPTLYCLIRPFINKRKDDNLVNRLPVVIKENVLKNEEVYKKSQFGFAFFFKLFILLILGFSLVHSVAKAQTGARSLKTFDPYEILQITPDVTEKEIKKAYRDLARKYHPDKNKGDPEAAAMFMLVVKAYECLTDENVKENCEKYGNPDGKSSYQVAIALPVFLLKKENKVAVLVIFFLVLLVFLPIVFYIWYAESNAYTENGMLRESQNNLWILRNENLILKNLLEFLALSAEVSKYLSTTQEQARDLQKLKDDAFKPKEGENRFKKFLKPYYMLVGYIKRDNIGKSIQPELFEMLRKLPPVVDSAIEIVFAFASADRKNISLPFRTLSNVINYSQMFYQGLNTNSSSLCQLIGIDETEATYIKKKLKRPNLTIPNLLTTPELSESFLSFIPENSRTAIKQQLDYFPNVELEARSIVKSDSESGDKTTLFYRGDFITFEAKITLKNLKDKELSGYMQSATYPFKKLEKWYLIAYEPKLRIYLYWKKLTNLKRVTVEEFGCYSNMFPPGQYSLQIFLKSECYKDFDLETTINFEICKDTFQSEHKLHPEDEKALKEGTLFNLAQGLGGKSMYDEEEDDEDDDPVSEVPPPVNLSGSTSKENIASNENSQPSESNESKKDVQKML